MPQMPKELNVVDFSHARTVNDLKILLNKQNKINQEFYRRIFNDIHWKESIYFVVGGKKWRITVIPGDFESDSEEHLRVQRFTGTDFRNPSHWTDEYIWHGGPPVEDGGNGGDLPG